MNHSDRSFEDQQDAALGHMRSTVVAAIDEACEAFAKNMSAAERSGSPPPREFFASCVMQLAYCVQCGADITFDGGDPKVAWHAIKNAVNISNRYWGSKFELQNDELSSMNDGFLG